MSNTGICPFCHEEEVPSGGTCPRCGTGVPRGARRKHRDGSPWTRHTTSGAATDSLYHGSHRDDT